MYWNADATSKLTIRLRRCTSTELIETYTTVVPPKEIDDDNDNDDSDDIVRRQQQVDDEDEVDNIYQLNRWMITSMFN